MAVGLTLLFFQYWMAIIFKLTVPPPFGFLSIILITVFGITSFVTIVRHKEMAISLFISSFFGLCGIVLLLGEFLLPH